MSASCRKGKPSESLVVERILIHFSLENLYICIFRRLALEVSLVRSRNIPGLRDRGTSRIELFAGLHSTGNRMNRSPFSHRP
jgi:hypothetical protein